MYFGSCPRTTPTASATLSPEPTASTWPEGTGPGQVEIEDGNPIRVTWHLSPTSNSIETFELSYEALGVVRQDDNADVLDWQALPESYEYTIANSPVTFTYPQSADLQGPPVLLDSKGDITADGNQVRVTAGNLGPNEPLVARLDLRARYSNI